MQGNYALREAAENGHLHIVRYLIEKVGLTANDFSVYGFEWLEELENQDVFRYLDKVLDSE